MSNGLVIYLMVAVAVFLVIAYVSQFSNGSEMKVN